MWEDPIVEEVQRVRQAYAKQFDYDIQRIVEHLQILAKQHPEKMVSYPPKRPREEKTA